MYQICHPILFCFALIFSENYAFKVQIEIQDMHWFSFQITVLMHITYHQNLTFDLAHLESKIL
jgi:hypothetical protein